MTSEKRIPGQSNAEYECSEDPNAQFIGTQSLEGGEDFSFVYRAIRGLMSWRDRRRARRRT